MKALTSASSLTATTAAAAAALLLLLSSACVASSASSALDDPIGVMGSSSSSGSSAPLVVTKNTGEATRGFDGDGVGRRSLLQAPSWHPTRAARRGDRATTHSADASNTPAVPAATAVVDDDGGDADAAPSPPAEPVYNEMPHDPGMVKGCVKYQWQPRVNTSHHVEGRGTRSQKSLGCNKLRKYRDYLELGIVAADLGEGTVHSHPILYAFIPCIRSTFYLRPSQLKGTV